MSEYLSQPLQERNVSRVDLVRSALERLGERFIPDHSEGHHNTLLFAITFPDTAEVVHQYVVIDNGTFRIESEGHPHPRTTFIMSQHDLEDYTAGRIDGTSLFMSGKLKLMGELFFAITFQSYFRGA